MSFLCLKKIISPKFFLPLRNCYSKFPEIGSNSLQNQKTILDNDTVALLERLSLVQCDTEEGIKVLEDSILFANKILHIPTDNVQPLYSVLENEYLHLRPDKITQGFCQKDILKNASVTEDDCFVAPPGNIPLHEIEQEEKVSSRKLENGKRNTENSEHEKVL